MDRVCAFAISGTGVAPEQVIRTAKMTKKGLRRSFCTLWSCLSLFQGGYDVSLSLRFVSTTRSPTYILPKRSRVSHAEG